MKGYWVIWASLITVAFFFTVVLSGLTYITIIRINQEQVKMKLDLDALKRRDERRLLEISNDTILKVSDIVEEAFKHKRLIAVSKDLLIAIEENRGTEVEIQNEE